MGRIKACCEDKSKMPNSARLWLIVLVVAIFFIAAGCKSESAKASGTQSGETNEQKTTELAPTENNNTDNVAVEEHKWVEATCTEPKTCSECGETEGEPLGHTWKEATCTEPKTCEKCGATEGEPNDHSWIEATCTEPKTCSVCGETEGEPLGHKWTEATCTEPSVCSVCGAIGQEAIGHQVTEWAVEKKATCAEEGVETGTCEVCGETQTRSIALLEHTFGNWRVTKTATCTEKGTEQRKCSVCGKEETRDIDKVPHTEGDWVIVEQATYTDSGVRTKSCKVCKKELKREKYSLTDAEKITWLKKNCKADTYNDLARNPEANKGKYVKFTCYILQVVSDAADANHYSVYRAATKGRWDNVILLYIDNYGKGRLLEDDRVTIYGTFEGLYTYESVMGASITVPQVIANHYE